MSQSTERDSFPVNVLLTLDDHGEPQSVTVEGVPRYTPRSGVHAFANEALDRHFPDDEDHAFRVQITPVEDRDGFTVFEIVNRR